MAERVPASHDLPAARDETADFLIAYFEIDIWKQYRSKNLQDIQEDVKYCQNEQVRKLDDATNNYARLLAYLLDDDVTDTYQAQYPGMDVDIMTKINLLHKAFKTYFPNYNNPVKEKYFISARICEFEDMRKNVTSQVTGKQRILRNMGPSWPNKSSYEQAVQKLTDVSLKMVNQELAVLYDFLPRTDVYSIINSSCSRFGHKRRKNGQMPAQSWLRSRTTSRP